MKLSAIALFIALAGTGFAQSVPTETELDRIPKTETGGSCLIKGGTLVTITGGTYLGDLLIQNGKIVAIGKSLIAPAGTTSIDAKGKFVLPGLVDAHSHRGIDAVNEYVDSISCDTQIADVVDPDLIGVYHHLVNGVTSGLALHGSSNAIGGQSLVVKSKYRRPASEFPFPGAPRMVKFALGENVTQKFSNDSNRFPRSRTGVEEVYRRAFDDAKAYMAAWEAYRKGTGPLPRKDERLEALSDILRGKIWVQCHSYRQDEMLMMVRLSQEYGFKIGAMQHALESYKIAPELAKAHVPVSMFGEAWNYKIEVEDAIPMGVALCVRAGVLASVNTDTFAGLAPLTLDAAREMRYGLTADDALKLITINPAKELGIDQHVGSLEVGKDGDVSIWDGHPLSVYGRCAMTLVDGEVFFERRDAFGVDSKATLAKAAPAATTLTSDLAAQPKEGETYAIVGGDVYPVSSPMIPGGTVVLKGGKILAVGGPSTKIPSGAIIVSAKGKRVYPGLVDGGSDLALNDIGEVNATQDSTELGTYQPDLHAIIAINPESIKIPIARCAGVTTAFVRNDGNVIAGQGTVIDLAGYTREQMRLIEHAALDVYPPNAPTPEQRASLAADKIEGLEKNLKLDQGKLEEQFEAARRYSDLKKAGSSLAVETKLEAMLPYIRGEAPVIFHVERLADIQWSLDFAKKFGLRPILSGAGEAWRIAGKLAEAKVPVLYGAPPVSCPAAASPASDLDPYDAPYAAAAILAKAGVKFGLSTGDSAYVMDLAQRAGALCPFGLSPEQALRAITLDAATILGVGDRVGSLEPGKLGNIVIASGDILEITTQVERVFVNGKPMSMKNHFTELYRKYEQRLARP